MTELLERAFAEVAKLPEADQEALAAWLLEELASDRRWQEVLAGSADFLSRLADEALEEHQGTVRGGRRGRRRSQADGRPGRQDAGAPGDGSPETN